jgi:predicted transcriptional regulator
VASIGVLRIRRRIAIIQTMTVEELKSETAKLPATERSAFAAWIETNEDVRALRHEQLIHELQRGIEQADRGELIEADEVFSRLRDRQQQRE